MSEKIVNQYKESKDTLEAQIPKIKGLIYQFAEDVNVNIHHIGSRLKQERSLIGKIEEKGKYKDLSDITDVIGLRVITYFNDDVDIIADILEKEFELDKDNSSDKRIMDNPKVFGYQSLHYIVSLKEERYKLTEYKHLRGVKFEIQVRSILQHAWAEIEHDLGYKTSKQIPTEIRRDFSRVSGLLEIADMEFVKIKEKLKAYSEHIEKNVKENELNVEINSITLREYLMNSEVVKDMNKHLAWAFDQSQEDLNNLIVHDNIPKLEFFGIKTLSELDKILKDDYKAFIEFINLYADEDHDGLGEINLDRCLFFFYYFILSKKPDYEVFLDYMSLTLVGKEFFEESFNTIQNFHNKYYKG